MERLKGIFCEGNRVRLSIVFVAALFMFALIASSSTAADNHLVNTDQENIAIDGYDTVAYFTERQPVKGTDEYEQVWQNAIWKFSSAENRDRFSNDPERYAPRYGGFCVGGLAVGVLRKVDPQAWAIVDNKLYLNFEKADVSPFVENSTDEVAKADANWERLGKIKPSRFSQ